MSELESATSRAVAAGVSSQAITDMSYRPNAAELLDRAAGRALRYQEGTRMYSRAVQYARDVHPGERLTPRNFVSHARNEGKRRVQRYFIESMLRANCTTQDDFDEIMEQAKRRAETIVPTRKRGRINREERQRKREELIMRASPGVNIEPVAPTPRETPRPVARGGTFPAYTMVGHAVLARLRAEYMRSHTEVIAAMRPDVLAKELLSLSNSRDTVIADDVEPIYFTITSPNRIVHRYQAHTLDRKEVLLLNTLLFFKGQMVRLRDVAQLGLTYDEAVSTYNTLYGRFGHEETPNAQALIGERMLGEMTVGVKQEVFIFDGRKKRKLPRLFKYG